MSGKNQVYLAGLVMYLVASIAGTFINHYWLVLIASILIVMFTVSRVFSDNDTENLKDTLKFDWISIFAFAGVELVLTCLISLLSLPLVGFVGYLNFLTQIAGYFFIGYAIIRYTLANTEIVSFVKNKFKFKKEEIVVSEEIVNEEVANKVEEVIKEETPVEVFEDINDVEEIKEPEIMTIEYKKEEEIVTPYMEEEI